MTGEHLPAKIPANVKPKDQRPRIYYAVIPSEFLHSLAEEQTLWRFS